MDQRSILALDVITNQAVRIVTEENRAPRWEKLERPNDPQVEESPPILVSPGFFDIQVNGYQGKDFTSPELLTEDVFAVAESLWAFGVTRFLPTVITQSRAVLIHCLRTIAQAVNEYPILKQRIPGIHLEGPYISPQDGPRGAHLLEHVRPPDWDEFWELQEAATGLIRLITLSPEYPESIAFIDKAVQIGVMVAIGHTAAEPRQIREAAAAGARLSTHLGNGCHLMLPRHPNYLWEQLAEERLFASLICDGYHLPPAFIKTAMRAKSPERCVLASDLSAMAGMPPGRYSTSLCDLEILSDGRLVVAGQRKLLAGASEPITTGIMNAVELGGLTLREAIRMASITPEHFLGIQDEGEWQLPGDHCVLFEIIPHVADDSSREVCDVAEQQEYPGPAPRRIRVREVYFAGERRCFD